MPTWKLVLEYKGTGFRGWQSQDNARTVQGAIVAACQDLFRSQVEVGGSGRTDAGVHALHQVAHLRGKVHLPCAAILSGLNHRLPAVISVLSVQEAPDRFHARHDAECRYYLYQISLRRTALGKDFVWWIKEPLDIALMTRATQILVGRHDFALYQDRRVRENKSTWVHVNSAQLHCVGELILFRIGASHFLWRMVRRLVGVLVKVGTGELPLSEFEKTLKGNGPDVAPWTAPSSGLFLECVVYPGDSHPADMLPVLRL
jgi:tRNA pseudouridine38-40 synthase